MCRAVLVTPFCSSTTTVGTARRFWTHSVTEGLKQDAIAASEGSSSLPCVNDPDAQP